MAKASGLSLAGADLERAMQPLESLEKAFQPLIKELPHELEPALTFHLEDEAE